MGTAGAADGVTVNTWTDLVNGYTNAGPTKLPDIGFEFCYKGKNWQNDLWVSDNGYLTFGYYNDTSLGERRPSLQCFALFAAGLPPRNSDLPP